MPKFTYGFTTVAAVVVLSLSSGACGEKAETAAPPSTPTVQLAPENVVTAATTRISSGPMISGQLAPAREAVVRVQVGGSIVALSVDRGTAVRGGQEIAKISSRDLDTSFESSQAAVKSAETALAVAQSEAQRTEVLVKGGALAARDLEQARNAVSNAEAQVAAARARQKSVWQQLDDTSVKAPFAGVVSNRPASLGDVVTSGTELVTIIDPSSMRLEAQVPSDQIQQVRPGARVRFSIRGASGEFTGTVDRVSPAADPITRQVTIFVSVQNDAGKLIAGLFAEGHVDATAREGIVIPLAAVDETGAVPAVMRIREGKAERVAVTLGPRQAETERVEVTGGVSQGDLLIIGSSKAVPVGTPVKVIK